MGVPGPFPDDYVDLLNTAMDAFPPFILLYLFAELSILFSGWCIGNRRQIQRVSTRQNVHILQ